VIECPPNVTLDCDKADLSGLATATDNCDYLLRITFTETPVTQLPAESDLPPHVDCDGFLQQCRELQPAHHARGQDAATIECGLSKTQECNVPIEFDTPEVATTAIPTVRVS